MKNNQKSQERRFHFYHGNVSDKYKEWPSPDVIISDGAYGIRGFRGDTSDASGLKDWYQPHLLAWAKAAKPSTSLWFWNTEVGWATVHPLLLATGWEYVQLAVWNKGLAHIAGNVNGQTIRQLPVVTEVAALYRRKVFLNTGDGQTLDAKGWLRAEWLRSGLPMSKANEACGVKNAATRKYLTKDWLWYWPPGESVQKMAEYCARFGTPTEWPYFSLGSAPCTYKPTKQSAAHLNQKPLDLMLAQVATTTNEEDIVWEPFGGLGSGSVASILLGRQSYLAEIDDTFYNLALERLKEADEHFRTNGVYKEW